MPKQVILNNEQTQALEWDGKIPSAPTQHSVNTSIRLYLFCYKSGKKIFYYRTKNRKSIRLGELGVIDIKEAISMASELYKKEGRAEIAKNIKNLESKKPKISQNELIELYSAKRIESFKDDHEANFEMIDKIASKLGRVEIIIRNRIDRVMCEQDNEWILHLPKKIFKLDDDNGRIKDHDILVSRQTFGFWVKVAEYYKIEGKIFQTNLFNNFSFKKYSNFNIDKPSGQYLFDWQIASVLLRLLKNIRNRAFHFENLFKMKDNKPRLNAFNDFRKFQIIVGVKPDKIETFLNDILYSFNEKLCKQEGKT